MKRTTKIILGVILALTLTEIIFITCISRIEPDPSIRENMNGYFDNDTLMQIYFSE